MKRRHIHQIITKGKGIFFLMQETKLRTCSEAIARRFWHQDDVDLSTSNSEGISGGLIILWNTRIMEVVFSFRGAGFLSIKVRRKDKLYYVCNVYSSCVLSLK